MSRHVRHAVDGDAWFVIIVVADAAWTLLHRCCVVILLPQGLQLMCGLNEEDVATSSLPSPSCPCCPSPSPSSLLDAHPRFLTDRVCTARLRTATCAHRSKDLRVCAVQEARRHGRNTCGDSNEFYSTLCQCCSQAQNGGTTAVLTTKGAIARVVTGTLTTGQNARGHASYGHKDARHNTSPQSCSGTRTATCADTIMSCAAMPRSSPRSSSPQ
jgi:hypothetical protein